MKHEVKYYTIDQVEREHKGHFFSKDTMRFFKSRVLSYVFDGPKGVFFVTSERGPLDGSPRACTIRQFDPIEKTVSTVGTFGIYTRYQALKRAELLSKGEII